MIRKKIYLLGILLCIVTLLSPTIILAEENNTSSKTINFNQSFSKPSINFTGKYIEVNVKEANSRIFSQGSPNLPVFRKTFELNWEADIFNINFTHSKVVTIDNLEDNEIKTLPVFKSMNSVLLNNNKIKAVIKKDDKGFYPDSWYTIEKSGGLNEKGDHVVFLTINIYPSRYNENENVIEYITSATVEIEYQDTEQEFFDPNIYDMVIITPASFKKNLTKLANHKNDTGTTTTIKTTEEIYDIFPGCDKAEKIKYFIKYAVEQWGIEYALLVGEIRLTPIRQTDSYPWDGNHGEGILSDLYYADIYDSEYNFSSWDTNKNEIFGEIKFNWSRNKRNVTIIDEVDLYPDVHVGRLACINEDEVDIVVDKIIRYETRTYEKDWFKRIILAGGDTFPPGKGYPPFVYEGEITNKVVASELPDFKQIKLWSSKYNLNAFTFNRAINKGAGFLSYAGHGFEHGWGTYRPNQLKSKMGIFTPLYYTPFIQFLKNEERLPIIFFDACLTAKLDFNLKNIASYSKLVRTLVKLSGIEINENNHLPVFGWRFMTEKDGGAIGTIGATRPAYSYVDKEGIHVGAGYLDWMFFRGYDEGKTLGEMLTYAQVYYMNNRFKDYFTIEEYILLGDPSLMVGGYPPE